MKNVNKIYTEECCFDHENSVLGNKKQIGDVHQTLAFVVNESNTY